MRGDQKERGSGPVSDYCYKNQLGMFTVFQSSLLCILCTYSFMIPMRETNVRARHVILLSTTRSQFGLALAPLCSRAHVPCTKQEVARSHKGQGLDYREGGSVFLCLVFAKCRVQFWLCEPGHYLSVK